MSETVDAVIDRQVAGLTAPGTWLSGGQRAAVATRARGADRPTSTQPEQKDPVLMAARRVAAAPATITEAWIDQLETDGLDRLAYVEVVGVVSRLAAIDTYAWATGRPRPTLPDVVDGAPTRAVVEGSQRRSAWVPIDGGARATTTLSAVAAESRDRAELSAVLYLDDTLVGAAADGGGDRDPLRRPQVEVIAARVSHRNDCFY